MTMLLTILAYACLAYALLRSPSSPEPLSLALVLLAFGLSLIAYATSRRSRPAGAQRGWILALAGVVAVEVVLLFLRSPIVLVPEASPVRFGSHLQEQLASVQRWSDVFLLPISFLLGLVAITLFVISYAWRTMPGGRFRFAGVLACYFGLGGWVILTVPNPGLDVWIFQTRACDHLLHGRDPYAQGYLNPYAHTRFYSPSSLKDGQIQAFPYPPLSLLLVLPGYLLGDVRWSLLAAMVATAGFMTAAGRAAGLPAGHPAELAGVALLCHPRGFELLQGAWTEPLLAVAVAAGTWAMARGVRSAPALALMALVSLKPYGLLWAPALAASKRLSWFGLTMAAAGTLVIALPFLLWDPAALWRGVVAFHLHSPFRSDCLSLSAAMARFSGYQPPALLGFLAAGVVAAWVMWRGTQRLSGTAVGAAAICLAFFLFNKGAFLNYYWLTEAFLALAVPLIAGECARASANDRRPAAVPRASSATPGHRS